MTEILRTGVLEGVRVVAQDGPIAARCRQLGAELLTDPQAPVDVVVAEAAAELRAGVDGCWDTVHAAFEAAGWASPDVPGGKLVLVAPREGEHVGAIAAALENLARTLSVEWARFGVRAVAVCPGPHAREGDVAELVAWLASPAGDYVSGCALAPGTLAVAWPSRPSTASGSSGAVITP